MIENQREYEITTQSIVEFEDALARLEEGRAERPPLFQDALRASIEGELTVRREQIAAYEAREGRSDAEGAPHRDIPRPPARRRAGSARQG